MLQFVIDQPRQRRPLAPVPLSLFLPGEPTQPNQVLSAGGQFQQRKFESLMFDATQDTGPQAGHGAPVENLQLTIPKRRIKSKYYIRFVFARHPNVYG